MSGTSFGRCGSPRTDGITVSHADPTIYRPLSRARARPAAPGARPMPPRWPTAMVRACCIGLPVGSRSGLLTDRIRHGGSGSPWRAISARPTWPQRGRASMVSIYHRRLSQRAIGDSRSRFSTSAGAPTSPLWIGTTFLLAFDTGPGNAVLGDFMHMRTGEPFSGHHRRRAADAGRRRCSPQGQRSLKRATGVCAGGAARRRCCRGHLGAAYRGTDSPTPSAHRFCCQRNGWRQERSAGR